MRTLIFKIIKYLITGTIIFLLLKYVPEKEIQQKDICAVITIIIVFQMSLDLMSIKCMKCTKQKCVCENFNGTNSNETSEQDSKESGAIDNKENETQEDDEYENDEYEDDEEKSSTTPSIHPNKKLVENKSSSPSILPNKKTIENKSVSNKKNIKNKLTSNNEQVDFEYDNDVNEEETDVPYSQLYTDQYVKLGDFGNPCRRSFRDPKYKGEYGDWFIPPEEWYPPCTRPPRCVSNNGCPVQGVYTDGTDLDLREFDSARKISPPEYISMAYMRKLNGERSEKKNGARTVPNNKNIQKSEIE